MRKYVANDSAVISFDDYVKRPISILDKKTKALCNKVVNIVKVQWQHRKRSKRTSEPEDEMREHYTDLFTAMDYEDEV